MWPSLAKGETPQDIPASARSLANADTQKEWWFHYGWNRPGDVPTPLTTGIDGGAQGADQRCVRHRALVVPGD